MTKKPAAAIMKKLHEMGAQLADVKESLEGGGPASAPEKSLTNSTSSSDADTATVYYVVAVVGVVVIAAACYCVYQRQFDNTPHRSPTNGNSKKKKEIRFYDGDPDIIEKWYDDENGDDHDAYENDDEDEEVEETADLESGEDDATRWSQRQYQQHLLQRQNQPPRSKGPQAATVVGDVRVIAANPTDPHFTPYV
tara:strand:+ start:1002 stop:1586 length:585 start_codon:yes stop_codon:yes gene_type:complete